MREDRDDAEKFRGELAEIGPALGECYAVEMTLDDARILSLLERLARVVGAMAVDTQWQDRMSDIIADIEELQQYAVPPGQ